MKSSNYAVLIQRKLFVELDILENMQRRRFLELAVGGSSIVLPGCSELQDSTSPGDAEFGSSPGTSIESEFSDQSSVKSPENPGATIFVGPDGNKGNPGTRDAPLSKIQAAVEIAKAGDRIHVMDGEYRELVHTVRSGKPEAPITVTGGENAVLRPLPEPILAVAIRHSHFHWRGLTINGLRNPTRPNNPSNYTQVLLQVIPPFDTDEYVSDIVIAPKGIGNSYRALMTFTRTKNLEIGPTKIIGLAGAVYVLGDAEDHTGEIIYLGTPPEIALKVEPRPGYPWSGLDETRNVHVHHIDNSAGHPHSELVNTKLGTRDVLVEYCTSLGGSQNTEPYPTAEVRFQSHEATLRRSVIRNGQGYGVHVVQHNQILQDHPEATMAPGEAGTNHSIYSNVITGFGEGPFSLSTGFDAQRSVCDNVITGDVQGNPVRACPPGTPTGEGIGHEHIPRSEFPSFREVILRFSRTLSPEELGDPSGHVYVALRVHNLLLIDDDSNEVLAVNVGAKNDTEAVIWGNGIYERANNEVNTWRFFGGKDETANLFITNERLQRASQIRLKGAAIADDISMGVSLGGSVLDEVALVPHENRWYSLSLVAN